MSTSHPVPGRPAWLDELRRRSGGTVVDDPDVMERYLVDWTGRFRGSAAAVVRPRTVEEVAAVMGLSAEAGFAVVPQGGNTGLVGGTTAPEGSVILNLEAMDEVADGISRNVVAGAGAPIAAVQDAASRRDLVFGLDMGSRDSATVGGALATNAGGLFACHWGRMRQQVTGVEAVLADGTVVTSLDEEGMSAAGTDPVGLLAGSEGTLAVVTAARLLLHQPLGPTVVVLAGFPTMEELLSYLGECPPLIGAEVFRHQELELVLHHSGMSPPGSPAAWYLLIEAEERHVDDLFAPEHAVAGRDLWLYRDRITESLSTLGVVHKFDVVVPPEQVEPLVSELSARLDPHRLFVFGHLLLADFHLNVAPARPGQTVPDGVDDVVYGAVEQAGGRTAGEHGIGRARSDRARASLPDGRRRVADRVKLALDPEGRLNPGAGAARI